MKKKIVAWISWTQEGCHKVVTLMQKLEQGTLTTRSQPPSLPKALSVPQGLLPGLSPEEVWHTCFRKKPTFRKFPLWLSSNEPN